MALAFYTGFDYYDTTQVQRVWPYYNGGSSISPGRFGGRAWGWNNEANGYVAAPIPNSPRCIVGMAFFLAYGDPSNPILVLQDATTSTSSPITQVDLRVTTDGGFQVTRNGTIIATTIPHLFAFGFWNYLEFRTEIHPTTGYVEIRINGQALFSLSNLNTQNTGNRYVNMFRIKPFANSGSYNFKIDDLYVVNDITGGVTQFLGECRIQTQYPSANGTTNTFSAFGAASNWQAVNQTVADDDTSYVRSATVGNIDDYAMGTTSLSGTIYGVQVNVTHRKDDVGFRSVAPVIRSGASYFEGNTVLCQSDYIVSQKMWETDPNTSSLWSNTSVSALKAGIKIKA